MSRIFSFELFPDGSLALTVGEHCIQTTARRAHREATAALLEDSAAGSATLGPVTDLLKHFLHTTDFAALRTEHPELAGGSERVLVRLYPGDNGRVLADTAYTALSGQTATHAYAGLSALAHDCWYNATRCCVGADQSLFMVAQQVGSSDDTTTLTRVTERIEEIDRGRPPGEVLEPTLDAAALDLVKGKALGRVSEKENCVLVGAELQGERVRIGHVGDCRAYRYRGHRLEVLTADLTIAGYPQVLERALGSPVDWTTVTARPGDLYLLCTPGLWQPRHQDELAAALNDVGDDLLGLCRLWVEESGRSPHAGASSVEALFDDSSPDLMARAGDLLASAEQRSADMRGLPQSFPGVAMVLIRIR